jgi:hypothetical protein
MCSLNEIIVDNRCKWIQHLLRMNETRIRNSVQDTFHPPEETYIGQG